MMIRNQLLTATALMAVFSSSAYATDTFSVGIEGFRDVYKEPVVSLRETGTLGSVTLGYNHGWNQYFAALGLRASHGESDYKSISGAIDDFPENEADIRGLGGITYNTDRGAVKVYSGLGTRLYYQEGKGKVIRTPTQDSYGYDRRMMQFYLPVGVSYQMRYGDYTITPKGELDMLLFGKVQSRMNYIRNSSGVSYGTITNTQQFLSGYGLRSELMFGKSMGSYSVEAGPFVRFWSVGDSQTDASSLGVPFYEPENKRVQYGAAMRVVF